MGGRRLARRLRQHRLGFWLAVLLGLAGLAYAVVRFTDAAGRFAPTGYEPKDLERQRLLEGGGGGR